MKQLIRASRHSLNAIASSIQDGLSLPKIFFVLAASIAGVTASFYAVFFGKAEIFLRQYYSNHPLHVLIAAPLCFLFSWMIVFIFAKEAKGSGIPQVLHTIKLSNPSIDDTNSNRFLSLKTAFIKIISSLICLLGAGAIGREGPTIQIGACIFHSVGLKLHRVFRCKEAFDSKSWILAGGAAGLAAAFNTPLGGLVYAIEELATENFFKCKTNIVIAIIVSGMAALWISGPYLYLGYPKVDSNQFQLLGWVAIVALFCGLAGATFGKILTAVAKQRQRLSKTHSMFTIAIICGLILAGGSLLVSPLVLGSGRETILQILFKDSLQNHLQIASYRFLAPIVTYAAGGAGGIFAPSLAAGATIGQFLSGLFHIQSSDLNLMVLTGMVSFLTGVTRTPFTAFVLVLEMTDRHSAIFSMMVAALLASFAARLIDRRSFYENVRDMY